MLFLCHIKVCTLITDNHKYAAKILFPVICLHICRIKLHHFKENNFINSSRCLYYYDNNKKVMTENLKRKINLIS